jgi:hypothetical protein
MGKTSKLQTITRHTDKCDDERITLRLYPETAEMFGRALRVYAAVLKATALKSPDWSETASAWADKLYPTTKRAK